MNNLIALCAWHKSANVLLPSGETGGVTLRKGPITHGVCRRHLAEQIAALRAARAAA